jgi:hypothetical protein
VKEISDKHSDTGSLKDEIGIFYNDGATPDGKRN